MEGLLFGILRYFLPRPPDLDFMDLREAAPARESVSVLTPDLTCLSDLSKVFN